MEGSQLTFNPNNKSLTIDSISNKRIFSIQSIDQALFAAGVDSRMYTFQNNDSIWAIQKLPAWGLIKDFVKTNTGFIAVGGKSFKRGYIYQLDSLFSSFEEILLDGELSAIDQSQAGHVVACGYGVVWLKEVNSDWKLLEIKGDFFTDISFIENHGLCVGSNGAVLTSTDGGLTWDALTESNQLIGSNTTWNTIEAHDDYWLLGGRNGALARIRKDFSSNEEWRLDDQIDILSIAVLDNQIYFGGRTGEFLSTPLPE